ncbi:uncharacterized protein LOC124208113 [Daphnia pulex]|uniref:uncharacterized protein LOC124208113 n=1 Tax=Daphnia pulex TaxID=6669 RepID=UPI001EDEE182|nr:uncharacterized protein LOC124208113 [Daphnia pulex]
MNAQSLHAEKRVSATRTFYCVFIGLKLSPLSLNSNRTTISLAVQVHCDTMKPSVNIKSTQTLSVSNHYVHKLLGASHNVLPVKARMRISSQRENHHGSQFHIRESIQHKKNNIRLEFLQHACRSWQFNLIMWPETPVHIFPNVVSCFTYVRFVTCRITSESRNWVPEPECLFVSDEIPLFAFETGQKCVADSVFRGLSLPPYFSLLHLEMIRYFHAIKPT